MEHISSFFKVEKDIFYQVGEKRGIEKKNFEFVKNLLLQTDFTIDKIAILASVDEAFVHQVKKTLK